MLSSILGANAGIGKVTALEISKRGARVLMLSRNEEKSLPVIREIKEETGHDVIFYKLNLASLDSIRSCANEINSKEPKIDILINNAGIMLCPNWKTDDGFDMQLGTNHLGHFLLTELLMPLIQRSAITGFHPRYSCSLYL